MPKNKTTLALLLLCASLGCSKYTAQEIAELNRGKEVYIANCLSCHGADGKGLGGTYPSLVRETITSDFTTRTRYLIENGSPGEGGMLSIPITKKEATEVINYIQNSFGNEAAFQTNQNSNQLTTN